MKLAALKEANAVAKDGQVQPRCSRAAAGLSDWLTKPRAEAAADRPVVPRRLPVCGSRHDQGGKVLKGVHCDHKEQSVSRSVAAAPSASHLTAGPLRAAPLRARAQGRLAAGIGRSIALQASTGQAQGSPIGPARTADGPWRFRPRPESRCCFRAATSTPTRPRPPPRPAPPSHAAARTATVSGWSH